MREILFRGKRKDNGEWVYGCYVFQNGKHIIFDKDTTWHHYIDKSTVGQYTGLTDRNGKKIFEGDLVKYLNPFPFVKEYIVSEVAFDLGFCGFIPFADYDCDCGEYVSSNDCEVIGNIHDTPELLDGNE